MRPSSKFLTVVWRTISAPCSKYRSSPTSPCIVPVKSFEPTKPSWPPRVPSSWRCSSTKWRSGNTIGSTLRMWTQMSCGKCCASSIRAGVRRWTRWRMIC
uniref:Uncharacterized protein n=1 Tax=Cacopsylla melanoneura TaxID=428564 RepID=A0A8D8XJD7_9HEMI